MHDIRECDKKGLTQKELAEKLAVSDKTISKWETGAGMPDISMLMPLAAIFEITVTELLKGERLETGESVDKLSVDEIIKTTITMAQEDNTEYKNMNVPGVHFNNSNWLPIVRAICVALSICMIAVPLVHGGFYLLRSMIPTWSVVAMVVIGIGFFVALFVPIYVVAKRYE